MVYFRTDLSYPNFLAIVSGLCGLLFPSHLAGSAVRIYLSDENAFRHFDVERSGVGQIPQPSLLGKNWYDRAIRLCNRRAREVDLTEFELISP